MKLLKKSSGDERPGDSAFAQRLEAIASRSKVGTLLYDSNEDAPPSRD